MEPKLIVAAMILVVGAAAAQDRAAPDAVPPVSGLPTVINGPGATPPAAPPPETPDAAYQRGRRDQREADTDNRATPPPSIAEPYIIIPYGRDGGGRRSEPGPRPPRPPVDGFEAPNAKRGRS